MTTNTTNTAGPAEYVSGGGLRALLRRLHAAGPGGRGLTIRSPRS
jgi:hypothetical protein